MIATGLRADGHREVLGADVGDSENETFWTEFLRDLKDRGLDGVRLVISDAHAGLKAAIRRVLQGAGWQRCRVHAMRNLLSVARHQDRAVIAALIRTIFAQPDRDTAITQLRSVVDQLQPIAPDVAARLQAMEDDLLAYTNFPPSHWSKIWSLRPTGCHHAKRASSRASSGAAPPPRSRRNWASPATPSATTSSPSSRRSACPPEDDSSAGCTACTTSPATTSTVTTNGPAS